MARMRKLRFYVGCALTVFVTLQSLFIKSKIYYGTLLSFVTAKVYLKMKLKTNAILQRKRITESSCNTLANFVNISITSNHVFIVCSSILFHRACTTYMCISKIWIYLHGFHNKQDQVCVGVYCWYQGWSHPKTHSWYLGIEGFRSRLGLGLEGYRSRS